MKHIYLFLIYFPFFARTMENRYETLNPLENTQIIEEITASLYLPQALRFRFVSKTTNKGVTNFLQKNAYQIFAHRMQAPFYFNDTECENEIINTTFKKTREEFWLHDTDSSSAKYNGEKFRIYNLMFGWTEAEYYLVRNKTVSPHFTKVFFNSNLKKFLLNLHLFNMDEESFLFYLSEKHLNYENDLYVESIDQIANQNPLIITNVFFIEKGEINKQFIYPLLHYTVIILQNKSIDTFNNLIQKINPEELYKKDFKDRTALHYAAIYNKIDFFSQLIECGLLLNDCDYQGNTPLLLAIMNNHQILAKKILKEYNCNIFHKNYQNKNALELMNEIEKREKYNKPFKRGNKKSCEKNKFYNTKNIIIDLMKQ